MAEDAETKSTQSLLADQKTRKEIEKLDVEIAKIQSEKTKINAEVKAGREPFYRTSAFFSAISPIILACLGLVFTWASGWFDVQKQRIENEKVLLTIETKGLEKQRVQLTADTETLEKKKKEQIAEVENYKDQADRYKADLKSIQKDYADAATKLEALQLTARLYNNLKTGIRPLRVEGAQLIFYSSPEPLGKRMEQHEQISQAALDYARSVSPSETNHNVLAWKILTEEWPEMNNCQHLVLFGENANKCFRDGDSLRFCLGLTNVMHFEPGTLANPP
jgi:hypothetical protein